MKRLFAIVALACVGAIVWFVTFGGWREVRIGPVLFRYHVMTGRVEISDNGRWSSPFAGATDDTPVSQKDLRTVELSDLSWGVGGMLVGKAAIPAGSSIVGRLGFSIRISEPSGTRVRERTLRQNVRWLGGQEHWFVLDTGLATPDPRQRSIVTLEALH